MVNLKNNSGRDRKISTAIFICILQSQYKEGYQENCHYHDGVDGTGDSIDPDDLTFLTGSTGSGTGGHHVIDTDHITDGTADGIHRYNNSHGEPSKLRHSPCSSFGFSTL